MEEKLTSLVPQHTASVALINRISALSSSWQNNNFKLQFFFNPKMSATDNECVITCLQSVNTPVLLLM